MTDERRSTSPWVVRAAVVLVLSVGLFLLLFAWPRHLTRTAERRWEQDGMSRDELLERHPDVATNAAAREIEALAARLGIELVARSRMGPFRLQDALCTHLDAELSREQSWPSVPPPEVALWLLHHASDVEALARRLCTGDAPRWADAPSRGTAAPPLNIRGHVNVQAVLVTAALEHGRSERNDLANDCLEAAWNLSDALWERTDDDGQSLAGAAARLQLGALRKIDGLPEEEWDARLAGLDPRATLAPVIQLHALAEMEWARTYRDHHTASHGPLIHAKRRLEAVAIKPAMLSGSADSADRLRQLISLDAQVAPCFLHRTELEAKLPAAEWNPYWDDLDRVGSMAALLSRAARLRFEAEMTRHVLRARRERQPVVAKGPCPDWTFRSELLLDGSVLVTAGGVPPDDSSHGLRLPLRWGPDPPAPRE